MMVEERTVKIVANTARAVLGVVVVAACVGGTVAATSASWPSIQDSPASTQVTTVPGDTVLVCSGSFRALGRAAETADQMQSAGAGRVTVDGDPVAPEASGLATPDLIGGVPAPVYTGAVEGRDSASIAASESLLLDQDDLSGLAATSCAEAATQGWIVGGSTETGANDVLVLSNPSDVAADVTLTVYSASGAPTTSSKVVAPQTQTALPLASIAANAEDPVVRVTSAGAPVRAVLQSALTRTLDPAGADLQGTVPAASPSLTFAGVQVAASGEASATDVLRLLSADDDVDAHVTVRTAAGEVASEFVVPLVAATARSVTLEDLELGTYSVQVEAEAPVVGAVWQSTGDDPGSDFAWMTPAPTVTVETLFAVPQGPSAAVHIVNLGESDATVDVGTIDGATRQIVVAAGESESVSVRQGSVYRLSADAEVAAALTMSGTDQLAGWPVVDGAAADRTITVYP